eukprot:GHVT01099703.1.p1 GENE.GHVT01099703.1~~GHVT01099703.1.p1  ORF type:complete len:204 (+),score=14.00 GHVT01099703.1:776-1387(+)
MSGAPSKLSSRTGLLGGTLSTHEGADSVTPRNVGSSAYGIYPQSGSPLPLTVFKDSHLSGPLARGGPTLLRPGKTKNKVGKVVVGSAVAVGIFAAAAAAALIVTKKQLANVVTTDERDSENQQVELDGTTTPKVTTPLTVPEPHVVGEESEHLSIAPYDCQNEPLAPHEKRYRSYMKQKACAVTFGILPVVILLTTLFIACAI